MSHTQKVDDLDEQYMRRAMDLAIRGLGSVSPNPLVGCVIVHQNTIIGEGWHQLFGGPHAEVNALNSVQKTELIPESTLYVNLEPCSHSGKTPPCVNAILKHQVRRVVIANQDSNPLVAGNGIKQLRAAGIEVRTGVLEEEGNWLNRRFFQTMQSHRPYIILKWAQTSDQFMAHTNGDSKWISNATSRMLVHKWRSEEDSILVGSGTARLDNPSLNVRNWSGRNPVRIVFDRFLKLNDSLHLFDGTQPTRLYNVIKRFESHNLTAIHVSETEFLKDVLTDLNQAGIGTILVEGGAQILNLFLEADCWDESRIFTAPDYFGTGILAPRPKGKMLSSEWIVDDKLEIYINK